MRRIAGLVRPGGTLMTAALRRSRGYLVGGKTFPSPDVDENDMRAVLEPCFGRENLTLEVCDLAGRGSHGYASIILARAHCRQSGTSGTVRTIYESTNSPAVNAVSCRLASTKLSV